MLHKPLVLASLAVLAALASACTSSGGPGTYEITSRGLSIEVEIPAKPEGEPIQDVLDYVGEMGLANDLTWAFVQVVNESDVTLYFCDLAVLDESGRRFESKTPWDLVGEAMDALPSGEVQNYNRGVDLINENLMTNRTDYLPGERAEFYVALVGDASNPSSVFGGSYSGDLTEFDCDNRAKKKS